MTKDSMGEMEDRAYAAPSRPPSILIRCVFPFQISPSSVELVVLLCLAVLVVFSRHANLHAPPRRHLNDAPL